MSIDPSLISLRCPPCCNEPYRQRARRHSPWALPRAPFPGFVPTNFCLARIFSREAILSRFRLKFARRRNRRCKSLPQNLGAALSSKDMHPAVLDALADYLPAERAHIEKVLTHPAISTDTLARVARKCDEMTSELIATNEHRLLQNPAIIDALYMNKHTRMSTADRLLDLAVRNGVQLGVPAFREAAEAIVTPDDRATERASDRTRLAVSRGAEEAERIEAEVPDAHTACNGDRRRRRGDRKKASTPSMELSLRIVVGVREDSCHGDSRDTAPRAEGARSRDKNRLSTSTRAKPDADDTKSPCYASKSIGFQSLTFCAVFVAQWQFDRIRGSEILIGREPS